MPPFTPPSSPTPSATSEGNGTFAHSLLLALASYGFCVVSGVFGSPVYLLVAFIMIDSYKNRHLIQTGKGPEQASVSHELRWLEELSVNHLHQASGEEGGQQEDGKEDVGSGMLPENVFPDLSEGRQYSLQLRRKGPAKRRSIELMSADVKLKLEKIGSEFELPSVEKAMVEAEEMGRVDGLSAQDVVDFIEAIKYLVIIEGGGVSISVDHMKLIRSSLFAFTDLAFTTTSDNAKASLFCLQKLPSLLLNIQLINQRACEQTDFSQQTNDSYLDLAIASHFITDSLSRAVDLITSSTSKSYDEIIPFPLNVDHISQQIPHYWVRERICTLLALTLGNRIPEATKELVDFIHQVVEQEKRDSSQTLTGDDNDTELNTNDHLDPDETLIHDLQLDPSSSPFLQHTPKTYLLYTSSIDTFLPVNPETPHIRTAIAQMSAVGLYPNDRFILLCAWHDKSSAPLLSSGRPKSNFLPNPPAMRVERRKSSMAVERNPGVEKGRSLFRSWFERVALVRLVEIVDLSTQSGGNGAGQCSRMTVEVLEEKDVVGFEFLAGMGGGDLGRLVLENRVRDSLRFGAVRVEDEFVRAFF